MLVGKAEMHSKDREITRFYGWLRAGAITRRVIFIKTTFTCSFISFWNLHCPIGKHQESASCLEGLLELDANPFFFLNEMPRESGRLSCFPHNCKLLFRFTKAMWVYLTVCPPGRYWQTGINMLYIFKCLFLFIYTYLRPLDAPENIFLDVW